ncbi:hypothetical protein BH18ACI5_BH18ACI5_27720 [soil metagenome]
MYAPAMSGRFGRPAVLRVIVAAVIVAAIVFTLPIALTPSLRGRLTRALGERFDSGVELASLRVSLLPHVHVSGAGLVLRLKGRSDAPPLITIASFTATANLWGLIGRPVRLKEVRVEGLEINIPAGGVDLGDGKRGQETPSQQQQQQQQPQPRLPAESTRTSPLLVDGLLAERAVLRIFRRKPGKAPRVWEIAQLSMERAGSNEPWPFAARLTNPIPPGLLDVRGTFGPWNAEQPSETPLGAEYAFHNADLAMFKGIRGILESSGKFDGILKRIEVVGTTSVPDFALDAVGQPVPVTTRFTAVVDGTNGNTWLQPVNAMLGKSSIVARGGILEHEGQEGRSIELDVVMDDARVEDVLRLAVKSSSPALVGRLKSKIQFLLPPGKVDALTKLQLNGSFEIASARFSEGGLQARINALSQKAKGPATAGDPPDRVASDFAGRFALKQAVVNFPRLTFAVPGARLDLAGSYAIRSEALDFRGSVRMDAKLSQLTTGVKSVLLKAVDPLVRSKNATVIPITVAGTAEKPKFGLDVKRALGRR